MRLSIDDGSSSSSPMDHGGRRRSSTSPLEPIITQPIDTQVLNRDEARQVSGSELREQVTGRPIPMRRPASTAFHEIINPKRPRLMDVENELDETAAPHSDTDVIPPHLQRIHANLQAVKLEDHPSPRIRQLAKKFTPLQLASMVARRKLILVEAVMRHAANCKNLKCRQVGCKRMKSCYGHLISCRSSHRPMQSSSSLSSPDQMERGSCHSCKQLLYLLAFHAKRCQQEKGSCPVPCCSNLRQRMATLIASGKTKRQSSN